MIDTTWAWAKVDHCAAAPQPGTEFGHAYRAFAVGLAEGGVSGDPVAIARVLVYGERRAAFERAA